MGAPFDKGPTKSDSIVANNQLEESARHNARNDEIREEENDVTKVPLEDLAPDGGWGYMVALGMIVVFVTTVGPAPSFTIVYGDFLESTGQAGTAMTILNSVFNVSFSCAGLMTNALIKRFPIRTVGLIGAVLYSVSCCFQALVSYFYELAASFFIQGIGLGLMFTICNTNFNAFFVKKRSKVMGVSQAVIGLGWIVYPIFIEQMMKIYGFRGTAAINGALTLNCIVGMAMMHPVEWYLKFPKKHPQLGKEDDIKPTELHELLTKSKRRSTIDYIHTSKHSSRWNSLRSLKEYGDRDVPLFFEISKVRVSSASDVEKGSVNRKKKQEHTGRDTPAKVMALTLSSSSMANLRMPVSIDSLSNSSLTGETEKKKNNDTKKKALTSTNEKTSEGVLSSIIDVSLLKKKGFLNVCLGISFVFVSDFTFASLLPLMMANQNYTKSDAAHAITVGAMTELISRILLAVFMAFVEVRPKIIFFCAMISLSLVKLGYLYFEDTLIGAILMVGAIGIVRSWMCIQPLVVVEGIDRLDQFASAHGLFAIISGIISTIFGPLVGFIKDWTNSYTLCQYLLIGLNSLFVIPWTFDFVSEYIARKT